MSASPAANGDDTINDYTGIKPEPIQLWSIGDVHRHREWQQWNTDGVG